MAMDNGNILEVVDLSVNFVSFATERVVRAVRNVSFKLDYGDTLAVIGESGCGKSTLAQSILGVLPYAGRVTGGKIIFEGEDLLERTQAEMTKIRGERISMILQDPMVSLNPVYTVGNQVGEGLWYHRKMRGKALEERVKELLLSVKIPEPQRRINQWPHEMSGGMRQRIVGAIAFSCEPRLILADEPTTNLDVTIQLQYLDLLRDMQKETGVTLMFITHDLGIVAEMCRFVIVMYAGRIVERAPVMDIYDDPRHPYTKALLQAAFGLEDLSKRKPIPGEPPNLANLPVGCSFHPRCGQALEICLKEDPPERSLSPARSIRCWLQES